MWTIEARAVDLGTFLLAERPCLVLDGKPIACYYKGDVYTFEATSIPLRLILDLAEASGAGVA